MIDLRPMLRQWNRELPNEYRERWAEALMIDYLYYWDLADESNLRGNGWRVGRYQSLGSEGACCWAMYPGDSCGRCPVKVNGACYDNHWAKLRSLLAQCQPCRIEDVRFELGEIRRVIKEAIDNF
ncbi:MAG: hypothetical protein GY934_09795 [Gammaproteobacteria bacterium]|nr:hypothetical protein [Gammaproteobacteria bacterium]